MDRLRIARYVLWGAVGVALFAVGALAATGFRVPDAVAGLFGSSPQPAIVAAGAPLGGPFQLVDQSGAPVTEAIFRDKPSAVLFGFTHCPDVCPTALFEMGEWAKALGPDAARLRFVFVTVDPARDTPPAMKDYLSAFSAPVTGITGPEADVQAMLKDRHVYFSKVPLDGGDYTMDHTASVFLLDSDGALAGTIGREETRETAVAKLKRLVAG